MNGSDVDANIQALAHLEVSQHFKERVAERVWGKEFPSATHKRRYAENHHLELLEAAHAIFRKSQFIFQGAMDEKHQKVNHYLYERGPDDYFVVITNSNRTNLITIYPVTYDLPRSVQVTMVRSLIKELNRQRKNRAKEQAKYVPKLKKRREEVEEIRARMRADQAKLEALQKAIEEEEDMLESISQAYNKTAQALCNPRQFSNEMLR